MLKERARLIAFTLWGVDLALATAAFFGAYWLRAFVLPRLGLTDGRLYPLTAYLPLLPLVLAVLGLPWLRMGPFRSHRTEKLGRELGEIAKVAGLGGLVFLGAVYLLRLDLLLLGDDRISRVWIVIVFVATAVLWSARTAATRLLAWHLRRRGYNYRTLLIVGTGAVARAVAESIRRHRYWGYQILGFVPHPGEGDADEHCRPLLGEISELPRLVTEQPVDEVVFAVQGRRLAEIEEHLPMLEELGICARLALDLVPATKARLEADMLEGVPMLTLSRTPQAPGLILKRQVDLLVGLTLLLPALPIMAAIALAVRFSGPGPVLFRQTRCGLHGRPFTLYKFRTMVEGAESQREFLAHLNEMSGPAFKSRRDPRMTRVGRFLRRFSLDELPQLWNVVKGEMSLVGPRPPIPQEVKQYERWQRRRLSMKPGLTCLWQVSGRNEIDFERWMDLDLQYIDTWSPLLDLKILAKTIPVVLSGRGAS